MANKSNSIGIIGGSGMLGSAILRGLLANVTFETTNFWVSNRSGELPGFGNHSKVQITKDNQALVDACQIIILCVPPLQLPNINVQAADKLVISVMAGASIDNIRSKAKAVRIVRAMSSPAAALALAYTPWVTSADVTANDRVIVREIFEACGTTDEIFDESQLDHFTAMTGPVPGFVAYFAQCMVDHATKQGIAPGVADRAIRQLFLASGTMLANSKASPADHVREMIEYAGTTAAGLNAMKHSALSKTISDGLLVAAEKTRSI